MQGERRCSRESTTIVTPFAYQSQCHVWVELVDGSLQSGNST